MRQVTACPADCPVRQELELGGRARGQGRQQQWGGGRGGGGDAGKAITGQGAKVLGGQASMRAHGRQWKIKEGGLEESGERSG